MTWLASLTIVCGLLTAWLSGAFGAHPDRPRLRDLLLNVTVGLTVLTALVLTFG